MKEQQKPVPERQPPPTYMPFLMALSLTFTGWGLIAHWVLSLAGIAGMLISVTGWIKSSLKDESN